MSSYVSDEARAERWLRVLLLVPVYGSLLSRRFRLYATRALGGT